MPSRVLIVSNASHLLFLRVPVKYLHADKQVATDTRLPMRPSNSSQNPRGEHSVLQSLLEEVCRLASHCRSVRVRHQQEKYG